MFKIWDGRNLSQNKGENGMRKLKFPVISGIAPRKKCLSMDDYLKFVIFNLKYTFNRKAYDQMKKKIIVDIPFSLKINVS